MHVKFLPQCGEDSSLAIAKHDWIYFSHFQNLVRKACRFSAPSCAMPLLVRGGVAFACSHCRGDEHTHTVFSLYRHCAELGIQI